MKKVMFGLCTLMMCFFIAACGGNSNKGENDENDEEDSKDLKALTEELENAKDWDADKFEEFYMELMDACIDYLENKLEDEDFNDINKPFLEIDKGIDKLSDNDKKTLNEVLIKLDNDKNYQNKVKEFSELLEKVTKKSLGYEDVKPVDEEMNDSLRDVYDDYNDEYPEYPDSLSY